MRSAGQWDGSSAECLTEKAREVYTNRIIHNSMRVVALACLCLMMSSGLPAQENQKAFDWEKAWTLMQKKLGGQQLTPDESTYLGRATSITPRSDLTAVEALLINRQLGGKLTAKENAQVEGMRQILREQLAGAREGRAGKPEGERTAVQPKPLDDMSAKDEYKGERGGLYGAGRNLPPQQHRAAAKKELAQIRSLDAKGKPDVNGKIVLLSIGMSNTTQEFSFFKRLAEQSPLKNRQLVIVDGAQGGRTADQWAEGNETWSVVAERLKAEGVTPQQVQAVWLKAAIGRPARFGEYPVHTRKLQENLQRIVQIAREHFPNLRIVYLSSRIYAGYANTPLNPEPYAYESAFAVRGLLQEQMAGKPELNYDLAKGGVKAPILLWGPYLWADGTKVRGVNGLAWAPEDFMQDGTHPSPFGREKVARMLYDFFTSSPYARSWFVRPR